ncbi:MAG: VWA domain-containing protein [Magnetococcales bacterium]|nr:VWA domain-containing protein [Magnetococcales bacterium]
MLETFHFLRPGWFLAFIPLGLLVWSLGKRVRGGKSWGEVCDPQLLPYIMNRSQQGLKQSLPWGALLSASLVIIALAGPVWQRIPQPVFSNQSALVLLLDLSRSMEATDLKPNRLTRARHKITDILSRRVEGQTALIVYAAEPFVVSPLTDDTHNIANLVKSLTTDLMPAQGSRPQAALNKGVELFKNSGIHRGDLLLITDGWPDSSSFSAEDVQPHRLSILGVGTTEGAPIPLPEGGFFSDHNGAIVIPKLNSLPLQKIATQTGGSYLSLRSDDGDINQLLSRIKQNPLFMSVTETDFLADRWYEEGPWLLIPVLIWAATTFRRQSLLAILLFFSYVGEGFAWEWDALWQRPDQRGYSALMAEKPDQAAELFQDPQWQAAAHYRGGDYEASLESLKGVEGADAWYNRGNALARLGRLPEALEAYDKALQQEPNHRDAKHNREVVKKALPPPPESENQSGKQENKNQEKQEGEGAPPSEQNNRSDDEGMEQRSQQTPSSEQTGEQEKEPAKAEGQAEEKKPEDAQQAQSKQPPHPPQETEEMAEKEAASQEITEEQMKEDEAKRAVDRWLRRIPDDPGGLLRRKFHYQYQKSQRPTDRMDQPW